MSNSASLLPVSIIVRTRNGAESLGRTLAALARAGVAAVPMVVRPPGADAEPPMRSIRSKVDSRVCGHDLFGLKAGVRKIVAKPEDECTGSEAVFVAIDSRDDRLTLPD